MFAAQNNTIAPRDIKQLRVAQDQVEAFCSVALDRLKVMGISFDSQDVSDMHQYLVAKTMINQTGMDNDLI